MSNKHKSPSRKSIGPNPHHVTSGALCASVCLGDMLWARMLDKLWRSGGKKVAVKANSGLLPLAQ